MRSAPRRRGMLAKAKCPRIAAAGLRHRVTELPPSQREALDFVLDDLGWLGYVGFVRESTHADVIHVGPAPTAREFFSRITRKRSRLRRIASTQRPDKLQSRTRVVRSRDRLDEPRRRETSRSRRTETSTHGMERQWIRALSMRSVRVPILRPAIDQEQKVTALPAGGRRR